MPSVKLVYYFNFINFQWTLFSFYFWVRIHTAASFTEAITCKDSHNQRRNLLTLDSGDSHFENFAFQLSFVSFTILLSLQNNFF